MKDQSPHILTLALLSAALLLPAGVSAAEACRETQQAVALGQKWILSAQKRDGLFSYEYFPRLAKESGDNNIVRQIGTFWALSQSLDWVSSEAALTGINRFREGIRPYIIQARAKGKDVAFIEFEGLGKVNAAALYLVSLLDLQGRGISLKVEEKADMKKVVSGLNLMQEPEGGFRYIYFLPRENNFITAYGTGEALYALAQYYNATNDKNSLKATYEGLQKYSARFLKDIPDFTDGYVMSYFSWGIHAAAEMDKKLSVDYGNYVRPMLKLALDYRHRNEACQKQGCIIADRVADSVFLEGMVVGYQMAEKYDADKAFVADLRDYIELARKATLSFQVEDMDDFQKMTGVNFTGKAEDVLGSFCATKSCDLMRNDLNQHAMIALMRYLRAFCGPSTDPTQGGAI